MSCGTAVGTIGDSIRHASQVWWWPSRRLIRSSTSGQSRGLWTAHIPRGGLVLACFPRQAIGSLSFENGGIVEPLRMPRDYKR